MSRFFVAYLLKHSRQHGTPLGNVKPNWISRSLQYRQMRGFFVDGMNG
jgi:hypothetical protein